jgi:hypothetical protein
MAKRKRTLWTNSDDKNLKKLLSIKGLGIEKIGAELNRSEKAIRRRCERLNISSSATYIKKKKKV